MRWPWREADSGVCNDLGGVRRWADAGHQLQPAKAEESRQSYAKAAWRWSGDHCAGESEAQST